MFGSLSYQTKIFLTLSLILFATLTIINLFNYFQNESMIKKLSISINATDAIMEVLKNIPADLDENFFTKYPEISADVRNTLFSVTSLQPLEGRISLISRYGDYLGLSNKMDYSKREKSEVLAIGNQLCGKRVRTNISLP